MRIVHIFMLLCMEYLNANHTDETEAITEDFPYKTNSDAYEESILLGRDNASGCLCRQYLIKKYVTCYDPILCVKFPKDVRFKPKTVRISTSAISVIFKNDFVRNTNLTTLRFEGNEKLRRIEPGAFNGLSNLENLTLTHNKNLMYLENDTFKGLTNLVYLKIYKNGFPVLKEFTYSINAIALPRLKRLVIAQMLFPVVEADDFEPVNNMSIENLNLLTCKIEYFNPIALSKFRSLKVLALGENNLNTTNIVDLLKTTIQFQIPLEYINLYDLGFKELPVDVLRIIAQTNITHVSLSKNRFERIDGFPAMPKIVRLDLIDVVALNITPHAFEMLPNLRKLYLNKNEFSDVPQAVLLPHLEYLDLSYSGKYFTLQDEIFINMTNLTNLNLSGNNIRKLAVNTFYGLKNLRVLGLKESKLFYIDNGTFAPMKRLIFLDLTGNPFPTRTLVSSIFEGLEQLEVLQLGNCQIGPVIANSDLLSNLVSLKHLGLENNALKSISSEILKPLSDLQILDISGNNFLSWEFRMFKNNTNLHTLIASSNKIRNITRAMILDFVNLEKLDLHNNPFGCSCEDMEALSSIIYRKDFINVFNILHQHFLNCTYPEEFANMTILHYLHQINETHFCDITETHYPIINIILLICLVLTVLFILIIIFIYRWHIRYWMFLTKLFLNRAGKLAPKMQQNNYQYDAFVSYSNEDQNFVVRLVTMLENQQPHYKLCVYERDFQIGTVISESVLESLSKSRKTLLIVSEAYIKSQWCRWEAQVAENHRLFFENEFGECSNDSLVIVKLGDINMKNVSPMLKYLMKTRIYLQWDENSKKEGVFWDKLRNSLSRPKTIANYIMMVDR